MTAAILQSSFAGGELGPDMLARVDLAKYRVGAKTMRNFFTLITGGAANRPGTAIVGRCKSMNLVTPPRAIRFIFSTLQAYMLEFGDHYLRVTMDGGYVLEPALAVNAMSNGNPGVLNVPGNAFANGDWIFTTGIGGLGTKTYIVANLAGPLFTLTDLDGNPIDTTAMPVYAGGGQVARIFTLATPWAIADLPLLKFAQSNDTMTLCHINYQTQSLTRTQHWIWTLTGVAFGAAVQAPTGCAAGSIGNVGAAQLNYYYVVTAINDATAEESVASNIAGIANQALDQNLGINNSVSWVPSPALPVANRFNIYRSQAVAAGAAVPTIFGYIGQSTGNTFIDVNFAPDFTLCPPEHQNPFAGGNNPGCTNYFGGRQNYAGSTQEPETVEMTKVDAFTNMDTSSPARDDDAITATLNAQQENAIKHLVSLNALLALTSSGAWMITSNGASSAITPSTIDAKPQAYNGCSDVPPLVINYDVLYVQRNGSRVRDLAYNFYVNIFTGDDKTVLSSHLFAGRTIREWAYAEEPFHNIWCVRDDGVALCFTYLKEQDVYAWSRHDTFGLFNSVSTIPEGGEDATYFIMTRIAPGVNGGQPVQYMERMASRDLGENLALGIAAQAELGWFVDAGVRYGPTTVSAANLMPGLGATVVGAAGVPFTTDADFFTAPMVGDVIRANGGIGTITAVLGPRSVTVDLLPWSSFAAFPNDPSVAPIPRMALPALAGNWSCTTPTSTLTGLDHLNGCTVQILADGSVQTPQVVVGGAITLTAGLTATIITAGLGYQAQLDTLPLEVEPTVQGKRKKVARITVIVNNSRGLQCAPLPRPGETAGLPPMVPIKERLGEQLGQPTALQSGNEWVIPEPYWNKTASMRFQQDYPLPTTILGVVPEVQIGDSGGGGR